MSRNLEVALHVGSTPVELPDNPPTAAGQALVAAAIPAAGTPVQMTWGAGGGGGTPLPASTREGQVLVSGAAPQFDWGAGDIDCSRY